MRFSHGTYEAVIFHFIPLLVTPFQSDIADTLFNMLPDNKAQIEKIIFTSKPSLRGKNEALDDHSFYCTR